ncbi:ethanolamine kinase 1-like [Lineus longissimus]|uniref:ethanolamine kinase 1-like n=1 Tax=Lineus longissimus TaxID=88925 RepID=UPI002B4CDF78
MTSSADSSPLKQPPHVDVEVDSQDYKDALLEILAVIRPKWKKDAVRFKPLAQGMINLMLTCYVSEEVDETAVVARIFATNFAGVTMSRENEFGCTKCFAELGIGPEVYCTFKNGICSAYVSGSFFTWEDISAFRDIKVGKLVAKEFAKIHCDATLKMSSKYNIGKGMDANEMIGLMLEAWPIPIANPELHEKFYKDMYTADEFRRETALFAGDVQGGFEGIKDTLCHNDPNATNFIYQEDQGRTVLIDYEMSGLGSPIRDLGTYICMSALSIKDGDVDLKKHSPEYVRTFARTYLEELKKLNGDNSPVTDQLVEKYNILIERSILVFFLFTAIFIPQFVGSSDKVDPKTMIEVTLGRLDWYKKNKDRILKQEIPRD